MATRLLSCLICPKRPDFSDTSHLLTHVSSKGHLSHLHKLQVRSHQEIAAGNLLVLYNQWYQEHGMGQLLSERMLHKESKGTVKLQPPIKKESEEQDQRLILSNNLFESPIVVKRKSKRAKRVKKEPSSDEESEYNSSPVRPIRKRAAHINLISPIKGSLSIEDLAELPTSEADPPIDPSLPVTPESSKLKGIIWPGMHLFDAASHDEKRKRNQKKDVSVLKRMEKTSELVEPWEVIYDSRGTMLKERFINGEVDSSSPLRGETPIPKPKTQKKKRQPLAKISGNVNRAARRSTKSAKPRTMAEVRKDINKSKLSRSYVPVSSPDDVFEPTPSYSPTEDENMEFRLTVGNLSGRKTKPTFTIFNDREETAVRENLARFGGVPNPFNMDAVANPIQPARPQFPFMTAPWLQPQNQQPQPLEYSNPYMSHGAYPDPQPLKHPAVVKQERYSVPAPVAARPSESPTRMDWRYRAMPSHAQFSMPTNANPHFFGGFVSQEDSFGYSKNPLSAAFNQMASYNQSHPTGTGACSPALEKPVSPDGTISDPDQENEKAYEQALFATSE